MHSTSFKIKIGSYPQDRFITGCLHHNGDWSGDVIIHLDSVPDARPGDEYPPEIKLPAELLLQLSHQAVVKKVTGELISFLEQLDVEYKPED